MCLRVIPRIVHLVRRLKKLVGCVHTPGEPVYLITHVLLIPVSHPLCELLRGYITDDSQASSLKVFGAVAPVALVEHFDAVTHLPTYHAEEFLTITPCTSESRHQKLASVLRACMRSSMSHGLAVHTRLLSLLLYTLEGQPPTHPLLTVVVGPLHCIDEVVNYLWTVPP